MIWHSHTSVKNTKTASRKRIPALYTRDTRSRARGPGPGAPGLAEYSNSRVAAGSLLIFSIRHDFCLERGLCVLAGSVVWNMVGFICQRLSVRWYRSLNAGFYNVLCINTLYYKHTSPPTAGVWKWKMLCHLESQFYHRGRRINELLVSEIKVHFFQIYRFSLTCKR